MASRSMLCWWGAAGAALSAAASNAFAGLTPVGPAGAHEATQEQILEHVYGVDLARSGSDFVGKGLTVSRVDDTADRTITFGAPARVDLVAVFTDWKWDYSMRDASGHTVGGGSQAGTGFGASGGFNVTDTGRPLQFVIDHGANHELRSGDAVDQLITYKVSGADGRNERVFFWEDWTRRQHADGDFNDLVFRATRAEDLSGGASAQAPAGPVSIPLPPAAWSGAAGLIGTALTTARRVRRKV